MEKFHNGHKKFQQKIINAPPFIEPILTNNTLNERYLNTLQKTSKIH